LNIIESLITRGLFLLFGSRVTFTKINRLSWAANSTLLSEEAGVPSMFRLKTELLPPPSLIEEIMIAEELLL
jgi:hypothetical protein